MMNYFFNKNDCYYKHSLYIKFCHETHLYNSYCSLDAKEENTTLKIITEELTFDHRESTTKSMLVIKEMKYLYFTELKRYSWQTKIKSFALTSSYIIFDDYW